MKTYTTREVNLNFIIKAFQNWNGIKLNTALGVSGLENLIGKELAAKFIDRAMRSTGDVCHCKVYNGPKVSFYLH